jgi:hypothetical protein
VSPVPLNVAGITAALESHALTLGLFERVNAHEPANPPGQGLTCAIFFATLDPARGTSGLNATSGRLAFTARIFSSLAQEPQDAIDPNILTATSALMGAYSGDFELGGLIRNVDLLGQTGVPLSAKSGYVEVSGAKFRVVDILLPLIINDVWEQVS